MEIVSAQKRAGAWLYEVRDLRTTAGVTRDRAQGLWSYAISRYEDLRDGRIDIQSQVKWRGRLGLWRATVRATAPSSIWCIVMPMA